MASVTQMKRWGMGIATLALIFGVVIAVLGDMQTQFNESDNPEAHQAIQDGIDAVSEFTGWFGLIVMVVVAGIVISLVQSGILGGGNSGGGRRRARRK